MVWRGDKKQKVDGSCLLLYLYIPLSKNFKYPWRSSGDTAPATGTEAGTTSTCPFSPKFGCRITTQTPKGVAALGPGLEQFLPWQEPQEHDLLFTNTQKRTGMTWRIRFSQTSNTTNEKQVIHSHIKNRRTITNTGGASSKRLG